MTIQLPSLVRHAAAALALGAATLSPAAAMTLTTGSYANTGIGAEFASAYDNFSVDGASIDFALESGSMDVTLGEYAFEVGPNCYSCTLTPTFDALIDVTIDGITRQLDLMYSWQSTGPTDNLSFATPTPLLFDFGALGYVTVAVANPGVLASPGGIVRGNIGASVLVTPVPEPASVALMLAGLGAIGFVVRRRRS